MTRRSVHPLSFALPDGWDKPIDAWTTWLLAAGTSTATRRLRRAHIRSMARETATEAPDKVTTLDLLALVGKPGYATEYRRSLRSSYVIFFGWCVKSGLAQEDPTTDLPIIRAPGGAPKPATDGIWEQILACPDSRTVLMARLAAEAGMRRAEVAVAHTNDVIGSPEGAQLIVHGKGNKQRVVPITQSLSDALIAAQPRGGFVFPGQIDGHVSPGHVGKLVSAVMPEGWSMHKLRHRYATRGYAGTRNLRAVQMALGHASVATTERYTLVSTSEVRAVTEAASKAAS